MLSTQQLLNKCQMTKIPVLVHDQEHPGSLSNQKSFSTSDSISQSWELWVLVLVLPLMCHLELVSSPSELISSAGLNGGLIKALPAEVCTHIPVRPAVTLNPGGAISKPRGPRSYWGPWPSVEDASSTFPRSVYLHNTHLVLGLLTRLLLSVLTAIYTARAPACDGAVAHEQ